MIVLDVIMEKVSAVLTQLRRAAAPLHSGKKLPDMRCVFASGNHVIRAAGREGQQFLYGMVL